MNLPSGASGVVQLIRNTADTTIAGFEADATIRLTDSLLLTVTPQDSLAYLTAYHLFVDTLVTAGVYQREYRPLPAPLKVIYETWEGAANSGRYFDDDGDCSPNLDEGFENYDEDVLDGLETIQICVGYACENGQPVPNPVDSDDYEGLHPVYEEVPGWSESTLGARTLEELPQAARDYISKIEEVVGAPIDIISTGPDREETIIRRHPFE